MMQLVAERPTAWKGREMRIRASPHVRSRASIAPPPGSFRFSHHGAQPHTMCMGEGIKTHTVPIYPESYQKNPEVQARRRLVGRSPAIEAASQQRGTPRA